MTIGGRWGLPTRAHLVQYGVATLVSLAALASGGWLTWPSTSNELLLRGQVCCKADKDQVSTMVALMDLGNILTPIPASYLADLYGRKPIVQSTALMFIVACVCVMVADNMWYLYIGRLLAGMGKGIAFGVIPILLAEIAQVPIRGALGTVFTAFVSAGISYDYIFGAFLTYQGLNIANIIIPIVFGIGYIFVPESPYYLIMKGKDKQALKTLSTYRQLPITNDVLKCELQQIKETVEEDMKNKARFVDVVSTKSMRRALMISSLSAFFQRAAGISPLLAFSTITLPETGGGASRQVYVIIFSFLIVLGNYVGITLVDKWGRKILYLYSTIGCGIADFIFAVYFSFKSSGADMSGALWVPYATLLFFGFVWGTGMSYIPSIWVSELFPTNVKSYAGSIQSIMFAVASFVANKLFGLTSDSPHLMFYVFFCSCILCSLFTIFLIFETTGMTFQEIQQALRKLTGEDNEQDQDQELDIKK